MFESIKFYIVVTAEKFGWLNIVDEKIISNYLAWGQQSIIQKAKIKKTNLHLARNRNVAVLLSLISSMTIGAMVLLILDSKGIIEIPMLASENEIISIKSNAAQIPSRWDHIEVFYSGAISGGGEQNVLQRGLNTLAGLNCHFVVCNGTSYKNGKILRTDRWLNQLSAVHTEIWHGGVNTIRICVIGDTESLPSIIQKKRTDALIKILCEKFGISKRTVYYPEYWHRIAEDDWI